MCLRRSTAISVLPEPAPPLAKVIPLVVLAMTSIENGNGILLLRTFEKLKLVFSWGGDFAWLIFSHQLTDRQAFISNVASSEPDLFVCYDLGVLYPPVFSGSAMPGLLSSATVGARSLQTLIDT